jgi:hypothetical protein
MHLWPGMTDEVIRHFQNMAIVYGMDRGHEAIVGDYCSMCKQGPYSWKACPLVPKAAKWVTDHFTGAFVGMGGIHACRVCQFWMAQWLASGTHEDRSPSVFYYEEVQKLHPLFTPPHAESPSRTGFTSSTFMRSTDLIYLAHRVTDHWTPDLAKQMAEIQEAGDAKAKGQGKGGPGKRM